MADSSDTRAKENSRVMPSASLDSESKKSLFTQKLEEVKYRGASQKSYSQAMAVFKTKNNYLSKIK